MLPHVLTESHTRVLPTTSPLPPVIIVLSKKCRSLATLAKMFFFFAQRRRLSKVVRLSDDGSRPWRLVRTPPPSPTRGQSETGHTVPFQPLLFVTFGSESRRGHNARAYTMPPPPMCRCGDDSQRRKPWSDRVSHGGHLLWRWRKWGNRGVWNIKHSAA